MSQRPRGGSKKQRGVFWKPGQKWVGSRWGSIGLSTDREGKEIRGIAGCRMC